MAAKSSKAKTENQETGVDKVSTPAETSEPVETPEEPTEGSDTEEDSDVSVSEEPKMLIATRPILYLAKQYKAGACLPVNNQEMVSAWIEARSAAWQKPSGRRFP